MLPGKEKGNDPAVAWHGLQQPSASGTSFSDWIGGTCYADTSQVWFPAKVGNYRDGSWESNIRMLTGTIKVDWIQLPVEPYLAALPTLQQGVIVGVFRQKGAAPWGITRAEKLQLSVLLPNDLSLEDWYAGVYGLPTVWPGLPCWVLTIFAKLLAMIFIS